MITGNISYAAVQIQAFKYRQGDSVFWDDIKHEVPSHSCWEDLTGADFPGSHPLLRILEDVYGLYVNSIGDWNIGYSSFVEHYDFQNHPEVGLLEHMPQIVKLLEAEFAKHHDNPKQVSITTMWSETTWQTHEGDYDSMITFHGGFNLRDLVSLATPMGT